MRPAVEAGKRLHACLQIQTEFYADKHQAPHRATAVAAHALPPRRESHGKRMRMRVEGGCRWRIAIRGMRSDSANGPARCNCGVEAR